MTTNTTPRVKYGVDLITLYDPSFWDVATFNDFYDKDVLSPERFWDRALDTLSELSIDGVEITFGPGHWQNALERYGSAGGFKEALDARSLELCSGFYTGLVLDGDWQSPERQTAILEEVAAYADFLRDAGCDIMIAGLPMRRSWDADTPLFVDADYAGRLSALLNRIGYTTLTRGVRLAIHPETHAVFWLKRDVDLFMALTDPVYVNFCPDTAHLTLGGTDPVDIAREYGDRIIITHWKDASGRPPVHYPIDEDIFKSHHPYMARIGLGEVDWHSWVKTLSSNGFEGWAILELDAASDPPATIRGARDFVAAALDNEWS